MAFASVANAGTGTSTTAGSTHTLTTASTWAVGDLIVLVCSGDNIGTTTLTDNTSNEITSITASTNTFTKVGEARNSPTGAAADGATTALFFCKISSQISSGSTITINWSASTGDKQATAWKFSGANLVRQYAPSLTAATGATAQGSLNIAPSTSKEYLWFRAGGCETGNRTWTITTNFTALTVASSGATSTSRGCAGGEFRIFTGTTNASAPSWSAAIDSASVYVVFEEAATISMTGSSPVTATATGYALTDGSSSGTSAATGYALTTASSAGTSVVTGYSLETASTTVISTATGYTLSDGSSTGSSVVTGVPGSLQNAGGAYTSYNTAITTSSSTITGSITATNCPITAFLMVGITSDTEITNFETGLVTSVTDSGGTWTLVQNLANNNGNSTPVWVGVYTRLVAANSSIGNLTINYLSTTSKTVLTTASLFSTTPGNIAFIDSAQSLYNGISSFPNVDVNKSSNTPITSNRVLLHAAAFGTTGTWADTTATADAGVYSWYNNHNAILSGVFDPINGTSTLNINSSTSTQTNNDGIGVFTYIGETSGIASTTGTITLPLFNPIFPNSGGSKVLGAATNFAIGQGPWKGSSSSATGSSWSAVVTNSNPVAPQYVYAFVVKDNSGTVTGSGTTEVTSLSGGGINWQKIYEYRYSQAGAVADGVDIAVFRSNKTTLTTGFGSLTVNQTSSATAKDAIVHSIGIGVDSGFIPLHTFRDFQVYTGESSASQNLNFTYSDNTTRYIFEIGGSETVSNPVVVTGNTNQTTNVSTALSATSGWAPVSSTSGTATISQAGGAASDSRLYLAFTVENTTPTQSGTGSITVTATGSSTGSSTWATTASSTGTSTATADGSGVNSGTTTGSSAGTSTTDGQALETGAINASATASGVGSSTAQADGSSTGTSDAPAVGSGSGAGDGLSTGTSSADAVGLSTWQADGSSSGTSTADGVGLSTWQADGSSAGTSTIDGTLSNIVFGTGSCAGTSTTKAAPYGFQTVSSGLQGSGTTSSASINIASDSLFQNTRSTDIYIYQFVNIWSYSSAAAGSNNYISAITDSAGGSWQKLYEKTAGAGSSAVTVALFRRLVLSTDTFTQFTLAAPSASKTYNTRGAFFSATPGYVVNHTFSDYITYEGTASATQSLNETYDTSADRIVIARGASATSQTWSTTGFNFVSSSGNVVHSFRRAVGSTLGVDIAGSSTNQKLYLALTLEEVNAAVAGIGTSTIIADASADSHLIITGSSTGTSTADGVGSQFGSTASTTTISNANGQFLETGSSSVTATASGAGSGAVAATISATSSADGVGASTWTTTGSIAASSSAAAVGSSTAAATGSISGTSATSGAGDALYKGVISATSLASGVGASTWTTTSISSGTSSASGVGFSTWVATGSMTGTAVATGYSLMTGAMVASSSAIADATTVLTRTGSVSVTASAAAIPLNIIPQGSVGTGSATNSSNLLTSVTLTPSVDWNPGDFVVVLVGIDNTSTIDGANQNDVFLSDSTIGNVWQKIGEYTNGSPGIRAGATTAIWLGRILSLVSAGSGSVVITPAGSVAAGSVAAYKYWVPSTYKLAANVVTPTFTESSNSTYGSISLSSLDASVEHLFVRTISIETNGVLTVTPSTNFTVLTSVPALGQSSSTSMQIAGEYRIGTLATATSNPTGNRNGDSASVFVAFDLVSAIGIQSGDGSIVVSSASGGAPGEDCFASASGAKVLGTAASTSVVATATATGKSTWAGVGSITATVGGSLVIFTNLPMIGSASGTSSASGSITGIFKTSPTSAGLSSTEGVGFSTWMTTGSDIGTSSASGNGTIVVPTVGTITADSQVSSGELVGTIIGTSAVLGSLIKIVTVDATMSSIATASASGSNLVTTIGSSSGSGVVTAIPAGLQDLGTFGSNAITTAASTISITTTKLAKAGSTLFVLIAKDNVTPSIGSFEFSTSNYIGPAGNLWTWYDEYANAPSGNLSGTTLGLYTSYLTADLPASTTLTFTFTDAAIAAALIVGFWTTPGTRLNNNVFDADSGVNTTTYNSLALSPAVGNTQDWLYFRPTAIERTSSTVTVSSTPTPKTFSKTTTGLAGNTGQTVEALYIISPSTTTSRDISGTISTRVEYVSLVQTLVPTSLTQSGSASVMISAAAAASGELTNSQAVTSSGTSSTAGIITKVLMTVGSSSVSLSSSATGISTWTATASSIGSSVATGLTGAIASTIGTSSAIAVGAPISQATCSSDSTANALAIGNPLGIGSTNSTTVVTTSGIGFSTWESSGSATGTSIMDALGTLDGMGHAFTTTTTLVTADMTADAIFVGDSLDFECDVDGAISNIVLIAASAEVDDCLVIAEGNTIQVRDVSTTGDSTVSGVGMAIDKADGTCITPTPFVSAVSGYILALIGSSSCSPLASGTGTEIYSRYVGTNTLCVATGRGAGLRTGVAQAPGNSHINGIGGKTVSSVGSASCIATSSAVSTLITPVTGTSDGLTIVQGKGTLITKISGSVDGSSSVLGVGLKKISITGTSTVIALTSGNITLINTRAARVNSAASTASATGSSTATTRADVIGTSVGQAIVTQVLTTTGLDSSIDSSVTGIGMGTSAAEGDTTTTSSVFAGSSTILKAIASSVTTSLSVASGIKITIIKGSSLSIVFVQAVGNSTATSIASSTDQSRPLGHGAYLLSIGGTSSGTSTTLGTGRATETTTANGSVTSVGIAEGSILPYAILPISAVSTAISQSEANGAGFFDITVENLDTGLMADKDPNPTRIRRDIFSGEGVLRKKLFISNSRTPRK